MPSIVIVAIVVLLRAGRRGDRRHRPQALVDRRARAATTVAQGPLGRRRAERRAPSAEDRRRPSATSAAPIEPGGRLRRSRSSPPASKRRSPSASRSTRRSSASPAGSSSTGASSPGIGDRHSARFGAAIARLPLAAERRRLRRQGRRRQHRDRRQTRSSKQDPVLHTPSARTYIVPYPKDDLPKAKKVYVPETIFAGHGAGLRRAVPEVRAPRLPGAVVPDVAVVRVPVPRLEVQPGR